MGLLEAKIQKNLDFLWKSGIMFCDCASKNGKNWKEGVCAMMKRILASVLCLALLLCALPFAAAAATQDDIRQQIRSIYYKTLSATGKETLHGYCGLMTAYQLYFLGIDDMLQVYNGNDEYDAYKDLEYSSGGFKIRKYPATAYTLEEALYTICNGGNRDAYNLLVGFQSTATEAGSLYGHAVLIHAILEGKVFFTEGFYESKFGDPGTPVCWSIEQFAQYYNSWATFEGIIEFGTKSYQDMCRVYPANRFVQLSADTQILTEICEDPQESSAVRTAFSGERLLVTAVYEDADGRLYYRVSDCGKEGFVPVGAAVVLQSDYSDITLAEYTAPEALKLGENFRTRFTVEANYNSIHTLKVRIKNADGVQVLTYEEPVSGSSVKLNEKLSTGDLPEGVYTFEIVANVFNYYAVDDVLSADYKSICLCTVPFTIGDAQIPVQSRMMPEATQEVLDGWVLRNGIWYCYDEGQPRTGWYHDSGIRYYLLSDGSVTVGWSMVEGKGRFFSDTGAMRTGWLETSHHTYYMCDDGTALRGWLEAEDGRYYFQENGWMLVDTWLELDGAKYYLLSDGKVATGWHTIEEQRYFFDEEGKLFSHIYAENGEDMVCLHLKDAQDPICFPALRSADE